jgi:site-specific DNA-adenine methylase
MTMRLRPFFSFYGAKWRAAKYYPAPIHPVVVEPFAGSACYALLHHQKEVTLIDADPKVAGLWQWLVKVSREEIRALPDEIDPSLCEEARSLIGFWFVKGSAVPVGKRYAWARSGECDSQFWGKEIKDRICNQLPYIRHWKVVHGDYSKAEISGEATWFIDPPYQNQGKHYRCNSIHYDKLSEWCQARQGQVIVCEQDGARWLPFERFKTIKALKSKQSKEAVYLPGSPTGTDTASVRALIDRATARLASARSSAEVLEAHCMAQAALHYARVAKAAADVQADCLRIIVRAEMRMADAIDSGQKGGEIASRGGDTTIPRSPGIATLEEIGVPSQRLSEWRTLRDAGESLVLGAIDAQMAAGKIPTKSGIKTILADCSGDSEGYTPPDLTRWRQLMEIASWAAAKRRENNPADPRLQAYVAVIEDARKEIGGTGLEQRQLQRIGVNLVEAGHP